MDVKGEVEKYVAQSLRYLRNASKSIDDGNADKASEFLWGSMAQALKAVAASRGIQLRNHRQIWDFAEGSAKELEDRSIYDAFLHANYLHSNFYEAELELKDVRIIGDEINKDSGRQTT
ncbi:MAG: hypothetical protein HY665_07975 [Chloroflexi bacterium]|nr:hypothetical protein [Chloroflexota bacterium]